MRDRAVHHLLQRPAVPRGRPGDGHARSAGSATRSSSRPRRPAAARCTSTRATRTPASRSSRASSTRSRATTSSSRRRARAPRWSATTTRSSPACAGADASLPDRVAAVAPRVLELSEFLVDTLGVTDVGARFPHTVAFHPTCHSHPAAGRRRPADPAARRGRGADLGRPAAIRRRAAGSAARSRSRTPTPRWRWGSTRSTTCWRPAPRC